MCSNEVYKRCARACRYHCEEAYVNRIGSGWSLYMYNYIMIALGLYCDV